MGRTVFELEHLVGLEAAVLTAGGFDAGPEMSQQINQESGEFVVGEPGGFAFRSVSVYAAAVRGSGHAEFFGDLPALNRVGDAGFSRGVDGRDTRFQPFEGGTVHGDIAGILHEPEHQLDEIHQICQGDHG
jgi:hypothetical protein